MTAISSKFMNIWEVESQFKCPVVGAILSEKKHKDILKKCGYKVGELKPYEYHQVIMSKLYEENQVSIKVNNFIRSKAKKWMDLVDGMSDKQMRSLWETNLDSGQVGPLMYAIISHEDTHIDLLQDVFGQVHMKAHANMTGIFQVRRELTLTRAAMEGEKRKLQLKILENKKLAGLRKKDAQRISVLEAENAKMKTQMAQMEACMPMDRPKKEDIRSLEQELKTLKSTIESMNQNLCLQEDKYQALKAQYSQTQTENQTAQQEIETLIQAFGQMAPPPCQTDSGCLKETCSRYHLCARRIFMIGGITKMKAYYKDIIEKAGGKFDYHDGYLKRASSDIESMVKRSDLVICPVNCNSHNACIRVKKLCNQHKTPLKILSSSSLSAVRQAVFSPEETLTLN
ncbi:MAG: DUF2325 domain-containing protein [Desulfobacteraceae bacterium]|nr:DUF2325 domain-containing protein [Desulfobacteraceae bacterium]